MPTNEFAPFGNPDGSRADIDDVLRGFVVFGGSSMWGGLATREDDLSARVIVGRKGSGKTVYLRRLQAFASSQSSLYADQLQQGLPTTETVIRFCQWFPEGLLTEKWMQLWRIAVLRSIASHLFYSPQLSNSVSRDDRQLLERLPQAAPQHVSTPMSVYSQVSDIINRCRDTRAITDYLNNACWDNIENTIADIIRRCPPICFYIDAVDEEFGHAPMYWQRCQKGLFYQVMRFLRDSKLGGRLHIIICIRDIVLSAVLRSENSTRYREEPHIRFMNWNRKSIMYFLERKLAMLEDQYFIGDVKKGKTLETWLGTTTIRNGREKEEPIGKYLLRHTRLLPRDVVIIGNLMCKQVARAKAAGKTRLDRATIRGVVSQAAKIFASEQLTICGNHIASDQTPQGAADQKYSEYFTSTQEYIRGTVDELKMIIRSVDKERFSREELQAGLELCAGQFGLGTDAMSVLWQNGLLGYVEKNGRRETVQFYDEDSIGEFHVPVDKAGYVFHSCLLHGVGIKFVGSNAVDTAE